MFTDLDFYVWAAAPLVAIAVLDMQPNPFGLGTFMSPLYIIDIESILTFWFTCPSLPPPLLPQNAVLRATKLQCDTCRVIHGMDSHATGRKWIAAFKGTAPTGVTDGFAFHTKMAWTFLGVHSWTHSSLAKSSAHTGLEGWHTGPHGPSNSRLRKAWWRETARSYITNRKLSVWMLYTLYAHTTCSWERS